MHVRACVRPRVRSYMYTCACLYANLSTYQFNPSSSSGSCAFLISGRCMQSIRGNSSRNIRLVARGIRGLLVDRKLTLSVMTDEKMEIERRADVKRMYFPISGTVRDVAGTISMRRSWKILNERRIEMHREICKHSKTNAFR